VPYFGSFNAAARVVDAESDWLARSTAAGVVFATDFRNTAADVTPWIFPNSGASRVTKYTGDRITGDGCLRIDTVASTDDNNAAWVHPLNSAWTTDGQGFGTTEWFLQVRMKLPASRLASGSDGGGFKVFNIGECRPQNFSSSRSHPNGEIVLTSNGSYELIPWLYRDIDFSQDPLSTPYGGGGDLFYQPALDNGAALADDDRYCLWHGSPTPHISPGCFHWPTDQWFTIDLAVRIVGAGSGNADPANRLRLWITPQGSLTRIPLWDAQGFEIGADGALPLGLNGLHLLAFDTGRTSGTQDTYQLYGQALVSLLQPAVPRA
jgi:hypothetical protein